LQISWVLGRATIYIKARRETMAKVIAVLYPDPVDGYPKKYARDDIPKITKYPDGQTAPTPSAIDFKPGELLGSVSGELGLRKFLEKAGHTLVVTSSKDGKDSVLDKELPDAEIVSRSLSGPLI
jgi:formate dehydrogenase